MPTLINARALVHAGLLVTAVLDQAPGSFQRASGEPGRKAKEEAAAAAAQAQAATQADADSGAKDGSAKNGSAKDAAAKGAVRTAKRRTKKNAAEELDIDSAFGEDSGGF